MCVDSGDVVGIETDETAEAIIERYHEANELQRTEILLICLEVENSIDSL